MPASKGDPAARKPKSKNKDAKEISVYWADALRAGSNTWCVRHLIRFGMISMSSDGSSCMNGRSQYAGEPTADTKQAHSTESPELGTTKQNTNKRRGQQHVRWARVCRPRPKTKRYVRLMGSAVAMPRHLIGQHWQTTKLRARVQSRFSDQKP